MRNLSATVFAIGLAAFVPDAGFAQASEPEPVTTFAELAPRLPAGSPVVVTGIDGRRVTGMLIRIERDTLSITADRAIAFRQSDVRHVQRRIPDSVLNGGFLGFAIGMAGPLIVCTSISDPSETPSCAIGSVAFGGLPGFAIGALIDRARGRTVTLFRQPTAP
jgi:hypothetical protein